MREREDSSVHVTSLSRGVPLASSHGCSPEQVVLSEVHLDWSPSPEDPQCRKGPTESHCLFSRLPISKDSRGVFGLLCSTFQNGLSKDYFTSQTQGCTISVSQGPTLLRGSLQTHPCCTLPVCLGLIWAPAHPAWRLLHLAFSLAFGSAEFVHPTNVKCQ